MLNYEKITFNEIDDTDKPLQVFYNYDVSQEEINEWLANEVACAEIPEEITIVAIELCLTIFSRHDFKLEAVCTSDWGSQYWIELEYQFTNADEFLQMIPDYGKLNIETVNR